MKRFVVGALILLAIGALAFSPAPQTGTPKRIRFETGAISAMVASALPADGFDHWVIRVQGGQMMNVNLSAWDGNARLSIWGEDGTVLISDHADAPYWSGTVPATQDYNIKVSAYNNTAPYYTMDVTIPPLEPNPPSPSGCVNKSAFVADITVPDGTPWQPNQGFNKIWRVQNIGTCAWKSGYVLAFLDGEQMTRTSQIAVTRNVAPGQTFDFLVAMNAPAAYGVHSGRWQMRDDAGALFGTRMIVKITTVNLTPPPQTSIVSPANGFRFGVGATVRVTFQGTGNTELSSVVLLINGVQVAKQTSRTPVRVLSGTYDWKPGVGNYSMYVVATDIAGQQATSAQIAGAIVQAAPDCQPSINFRADRTTINIGERVAVRWDVDCVQAVFFDGQGVTGHEARDVQPGNTTTYTLRITKKDGGTEQRQVTINVNNTPPPPPPPPPQRRDVNGQWSANDYLLELYEANGCSSADCPVAGRLIHQIGTTSPEIFDVQGSINVYSGAVSFAATVPGGHGFSGAVDASSRNLSGNLSGVGNLTFAKQ